MKAVSQEIPQPLTTKISLKITHLEFPLNLPWVIELNHTRSKWFNHGTKTPQFARDCEMKCKSISWWRHQMETFSALLAICAGNSPVPGDFPSQRPVTRSFDVFVDLHPKKRLSKRWWGCRFETPSCPLWRHRNVLDYQSVLHLLQHD